MSIKDMIGEYPRVDTDFSEDRAEAGKYTVYCAAICNSCAEERAKHGNAHCKRCEKMGRECFEDYVKALQGMQELAAA